MEVGNMRARHAKDLRFDSKLNPTRFVQYQPKGAWVPVRTLPPENWGLPPPQLLAGPAVLSDLEEHSLDGKDNILMGRSLIQYARRDAWGIHLARYWHAIRSKIDDLITEAAEHVGLEVAWHPQINFKRLETYWEFAMEDPVSWVREVEPVLTPIGLSFEARTYSYPDGLSADAVVGNSRSLTIRIRPGVTLRVYAKTDRRVRLEIAHDFQENASVIGRRHTSEDETLFFRWLETATVAAAAELNAVLARLDEANVRDGDQASVMQLVLAVTNALGDEAKAERALTLVATNGFLVVTIGSGLRDIVRKLRERAILEPLAINPTRYVLTQRYQAAGGWLSVHPSLP